MATRSSGFAMTGSQARLDHCSAAIALTISALLLSSEGRTANTMQTPVIQTAFAGAGIGQLVEEPNAAILVREMVAIG